MKSAQKEQWLKAQQATKQLTDGQGMPIDGGIFDTITVLRLLGINTCMSCEGHLDRGYRPYVSFEAIDAAVDRAKVADYRIKTKGNPPGPEEKEVITKISRDSIAERRRLFPYLDATPYIHRLAIENLGFAAAILRCQGAILVGSPSMESLQTRSQLLAMHQKEMHDFTEFLKLKFFSTEV